MDNKTSARRRYKERTIGDNLSGPHAGMVHEICASTDRESPEDPGTNQYGTNQGILEKKIIIAVYYRIEGNKAISQRVGIGLRSTIQNFNGQG